MATDDDKESKSNLLVDRDQFLSWSRRMRMVAMDKGDIYGIFDENGTKGSYNAISGNATKRTKWQEVSMQLIGTIGKKIENATLQSVWSAEFERIMAQGQGPPDQRPYMVALGMAALERECTSNTVVGASIARSQFIIALQSFTDDQGKNGQSADAGFIAYADRVKEAERKLAASAVVMTDAEKKQQFFQYFSGTSTESWRISVANWRENDQLTFLDILQKGILKQREIHLDAATAAASQVKAFTATGDKAEGRDGGKNENAYYAKGGKGGKGFLDFCRTVANRWGFIPVSPAQTPLGPPPLELSSALAVAPKGWS